MFGIDDVIMGGLVSGGLNILGGMMGNEASARQASGQQDFQERMSGSSHQREVADLRAAGLNPILSGTGGAGASTPSGAMARQENVIGDSFDNAVSSALVLRKQRSEIDLLNEQKRSVSAAIDKTAAETKTLDAALPFVGSEAAQRIQNLFWSAERNSSEVSNLMARLPGIVWDSKSSEEAFKLMSNKQAGAKLESDIYSGKSGEFMKYMQLLFGAGSAGSMIRSFKPNHN